MSVHMYNVFSEGKPYVFVSTTSFSPPYILLALC